MLALVDQAKPYIQILSQDFGTVKFQINGCYQINQVWATQNQRQVAVSSDNTNRCNFSPHGKQTIFTVTLEDPLLTVSLSAVVDRAFALAKNDASVEPEEFANRPRTHYARLRLDPNYAFEHKEHYVSGGLTLDVEPPAK